MNSHCQALVHHLLADQLRIDSQLIKDQDTFDDLGLDPLDLVLFAIRLEDFDRGRGDFPLAALERATTVGDLVTLVDLWLRHDTTQSSVGALPPRRSVA